MGTIQDWNAVADSPGHGPTQTVASAIQKFMAVKLEPENRFFVFAHPTWMR